jgi:CheY-like chemotaxis protein
MKHKILLVDDQEEVRNLLSEALKARTYEVFEVADGAGLKSALTGTQPDVVLLDLKLPIIDGLGVLRRIREDPRTRRLPVVILTTSTEERDIVSSYDLGANSYVRKPVDFAEFLEAARHLGLYWLVLNETPPAVEGTP